MAEVQNLPKEDEFNSNSVNFTKFRGGRFESSVLVLSVDDDVRNAVAWVLQLLGCDAVHTAKTNADAVTELQKQAQIGIIFCDLMLAEALLDSEHFESGIPVVLMCERRFDRNVVSALLDAGASTYIVKPIKIQAIRSAIVKHFVEKANYGTEGSMPSHISSAVSDYEQVETIGKGAFGSVHLLRRLRDGHCFAKKEIDLRNADSWAQKRVLTELRLHKTFDCPFIVRSYSTWLQDDVACLLMEYVEGGTLSQQVSNARKDERELSDDSIICWGGQIAMAIGYLHSKDILHRDLKLDNVLGPDQTDMVKVADFGVSKQLGGNEQAKSIVGTPLMMAPERVATGTGATGVGKYGAESDMWSLGVILYELSTLRHPFEDMNAGSTALGSQDTDGSPKANGAFGRLNLPRQVFEDISEKQPPPLPYSRDASLHKIVCGGLLQKRPSNRPTCNQVLQDRKFCFIIHEFLKRNGLLKHAAVVEVATFALDGDDSTVKALPEVDVKTLHMKSMTTIDLDTSQYVHNDLFKSDFSAENFKSNDFSTAGLHSGGFLSGGSNKRSSRGKGDDRSGEYLSRQEKRISKLECQLAEAKVRFEELNHDLDRARRECARLKRPADAAQAQLKLVGEFYKHSPLRWTLQFQDSPKEGQFLSWNAPRYSLKRRVGTLLFLFVCGFLAMLNDTFEIHDMDMLKGSRETSYFFILAVILCVVLIAWLTLSVMVIDRNLLHGRCMPGWEPALREFFSAGLILVLAVFAIVVDVFAHPMENTQNCIDIVYFRATTFTSALALLVGPQIMSVRWCVLLWIHTITVFIFAVVHFTGSVPEKLGMRPAAVRTSLFFCICLGLLTERRKAECAQRLQFLVTNKFATVNYQMMLGDVLSRTFSDASRKQFSTDKRDQGATVKKSPSAMRRSFSEQDEGISSLSPGMPAPSKVPQRTLSRGASHLSARFGDVGKKLVKSTSSLSTVFSSKLKRGNTTHSTTSEDLFHAYDNAQDDRLSRQKSLAGIQDHGKREGWLLNGAHVRAKDEALGYGSFGVVMEGELFGAPVAIKMPRNSQGDSIHAADIINELRVLRHVWHPNIVRFYGACVDPGIMSVIVVLELLRGKQLDQYVCDPTEDVSEFDSYNLLLDICRALCYLHGQKPCIVHGDLKGSNILVESWKAGPRAKLLDFGLSRLVTKRWKTMGGTVKWMAPEVIRGQAGPPHSSADVFSFGRLAFLVATGCRPLDSMTADEIVIEVRDLKITPLEWPEDETMFVSLCHSLADRCLRLVVAMRPTIDEVYQDALNWPIADHDVEEVNHDVGERSNVTSRMSQKTTGSQVSKQSSLDDGVKAVRRATQSAKFFSKMKERMQQWLLSANSSPEATKELLENICYVAIVCNRHIDVQRLALMPDKVLGVSSHNFIISAVHDGLPAVVRVARGQLGIPHRENIAELVEACNVLMSIRHPSIASLHGLCVDEQNGILAPVLEFVEGETLDSFVKGAAHIKISTRHRLLLDVSSALWYLHEQQPALVHGTLKGSKVMIEMRLAGVRAKLLDCGWSAFLSQQVVKQGDVQSLPFGIGRRAIRKGLMTRNSSLQQALPWEAPEIYHARDLEFTTSADVFGFGRLCYFTITGNYPLHGIDIATQEQAAKKSTMLALDWSDVSYLPDSSLVQDRCRPLCDCCCNPKAVLRPDMGEVYKELKQWLSASELQECVEVAKVPAPEPSNHSHSESELLFKPNVSDGLWIITEEDEGESDTTGASPRRQKSRADGSPTSPNAVKKKCCSREGSLQPVARDSRRYCVLCDRCPSEQLKVWTCLDCGRDTCTDCLTQGMYRDILPSKHFGLLSHGCVRI